MNEEYADIARDTLARIELGDYTNSQGYVTHLGEASKRSADRTKLIRPDDWPHIIRITETMPADHQPWVKVTSESTLEAIRGFVQDDKHRTVALNFASGRNPGGGFLKGTLAQEESIARASGLYNSLVTQPEYYKMNRACETELYTDYAIYSPDVPVFKDDDGECLDYPYLCSFITMPAPNRSKGGFSAEDAATAIVKRAHFLMALAAMEGHDNIVLGAWGCGVFRNDPLVVANAFEAAINRWGRFFELITFAIYGGGSTKTIFEDALAYRLK